MAFGRRVVRRRNRRTQREGVGQQAGRAQGDQAPHRSLPRRRPGGPKLRQGKGPVGIRRRRRRNPAAGRPAAASRPDRGREPAGVDPTQRETGRGARRGVRRGGRRRSRDVPLGLSRRVRGIRNIWKQFRGHKQRILRKRGTEAMAANAVVRPGAVRRAPQTPGRVRQVREHRSVAGESGRGVGRRRRGASGEGEAERVVVRGARLRGGGAVGRSHA